MKLKLEATKTNKGSIDSRKQLIEVLFFTFRCQTQWSQDKRKDYTLEGSPTHKFSLTNTHTHTQIEG